MDVPAQWATVFIVGVFAVAAFLTPPDPISQIGLAIPTLLLHNIGQSRAKNLTDILQHEAVAVVAAQAEQARRA